ncbi:MAG: domain S-box protein [Candidatus Sulfotelmatobacter sp.]|nr:domain S-box protein [Candidatus Sulfotelmatobacter sp.]
MKRATASRLLKAGIAIPATATILWLGAKLVRGATGRSADFMPHGYCYLWDPWIVWLHVISDGLITLSYYCIPLALIYLARRRRDLPFNWIFWMFGLFILGCGTTHLMEIWTIWHASYFLARILKGITAAVSVVTAAMLIPLIPKAIALPSAEQLRGVNYQLELQIVERESAEKKLRETLAARDQTLAELANNKSAVEELQQAQGAVRDSQDRLNAIIQSAMDAILTIDEEQHIVLFNAAAERMFDCTADQALGGPIERFIPERFHGAHGSHIRRFSETGTTSRAMGTLGAIWGRRANGEEFPLEASISQVSSGGKKLFTVILRDITERKRADESLKVSLASREQALKELADQKFALDQHAIVATTDVQGTITYVNDKFCAISKYSREELLGQNHRILNSGYHSKEFFQQMYRTIANGQVWRDEICNRAKDGSIYWVDTTVIPFLDAYGKPRQYMAIRADISERKRAEEVRERLAAVVESSDDAIISKALDGTITAWNRGAEKVFGYRSSEAVGKSMSMLMPKDRSHEESEILAQIRGGESVEHFETVRLRKDGRAIDISATISPIKDASGAIVGISKIARDITERKRIELAIQESLSASEAALKELADQKFALDQHAIVAVTDVQGTITYVNEKFCTISKYANGELIGQNHRILNSRHHPKEFFRQMYVTIANGKVWHGEIKNRAKDGSIYWVDTTIVPTLTKEGKPRQYVAIRADITERKRAEQALRESEERFQAMANGIQQLAWMAEADGNVFWYNQRWYQYTGTTFEQMQGWGWQSVHDPAALPQVLEGWKASIASGKPFDTEFPLRGADGHFRIFLTRVMPVRDAENRVVRWFGTNTDISEHKETEERLAAQAEKLSRQAEELLRSQKALEAQGLMLKLVLDSMGEGLIAADQEGRFLLWNDAAQNLMGREAAELPTERWTPYFRVFLPDGITPYPPEQLPLVRALRGEAAEVELVVERPEPASRVVLEVATRPMKDTEGKLCGGVAVLRDVTERKRAEAVLARQAEELSQQTERLLLSQQTLEIQTLMLQSVLDSIDEGLVAADETGRFLLWNPAARRIVGLGAANVRPEQWTDHYGTFLPDTVTPFPPEQNPLVRAIRGEACTTEMYVRNQELETGVWIEASSNPLKGKDGVARGGVVAFRDITQRKKDEREIRKLNEELEVRVVQRTAQLEAANHELEAFTYSVSHDLRAPLRHIGGFSKILIEDFGPGMVSEARSHLERIQDGVHRMGLLVDELLNLARVGRHALRLQTTGLNSIVDEVVALLQPEAEGRAVSWKIANLPSAECDPVLIKQVFQNLLANALKFTRPRERAIIEICSQEKNGQMVILVQDNGVGFNMKYSDKLFGVFQRLHRIEDFEGTGIGLATVHRIIHKHGGHVWAEAELDKGATFCFTLGAAQPTEIKPTEVTNKTAAAGAQT